jgi:excisionase family DNA binding protein
MTSPATTLDHLLGSMSRKDALALLAYVDQRQALYAVVRQLLVNRLGILTSSALVQPPDKLLTADQVAKRLRVSRPHVYALVRDGQLRGRKYGGRVRIPERALYELQPKTGQNDAVL